MERRQKELLISDQVLHQVVETLEPGAGVREARVLSGGLANTNYRVETGRGPRVLRLVTRNPGGAEKEALLLRELERRGVPVPRLLGWTPGGGGPVPALWTECLSGQSLEEAIPRLDATGATRLGRALGEALARIHERRFAEAGDLVVERGALVVVPWSFPGQEGTEGGPMERFVAWCLTKTPAGARLGPLAEEVRDLVREISGRWSDEEACLVHADFKPCNLFVEESTEGWELRGILDWEFAHAGSRFSDYGNLFRKRSPELPEEFEAAFMKGLREAGVELEPDWELRRACVDLTSALDFLSSERDLPQRHAACLAQVRATLALPRAPEEG
jgi:aminoglycoside phosphotransferase (APT) family kinase protein